MTNVNKFIDWLEEEKRKRGWSSSDLARNMGMSQSVVSLNLSGDRKPGLDFFKGLMRALEYPIDYILMMAGELPPSPQYTRDLTLKQIWNLSNDLNEGEREKLLEYLKWRLEIQRNDNNAGRKGEIHEAPSQF